MKQIPLATNGTSRFIGSHNETKMHIKDSDLLEKVKKINRIILVNLRVLVTLWQNIFFLYCNLFHIIFGSTGGIRGSLMKLTAQSP